MATMKSFKSSLLALAALVGGLAMGGGGASALTVNIAQNLTLEVSNPQVQQTANRPCVIGDNSCQGTLAYTTLPGNNVSWDNIYSPTYLVSDLKSYIDTVFAIGVDVNQTNEVQTLNQFVMLVNGVQKFAWDTTTKVPAINNGNGYSDYLLKGFTLAGLLLTDTVQFGLHFSDQNDGKEEFFLAPEVSAVPIPAALPLLLTGIAGIGLAARRRKAARA